MGVCDGKAIGCIAVQGIGESSRAACGRLERTDARECSVGIRNDRQVGCFAVNGIGAGSRAVLSRLQRAVSSWDIVVFVIAQKLTAGMDFARPRAKYRRFFQPVLLRNIAHGM